jgi:5-methylcytosine-specific restriction endonuclease McrA
MRKWTAANRERARAINRKSGAKWRLAHPGKWKERAAAYRAEDRDGYNEKKRTYEAANREAARARRKKWADANPGLMAEKCRARQAGLSTATPSWVDRSAIVAVYDAAREQGLTVDHIMPLKGENVCGLHVPWNLQLLSKSENSSKGNRVCLSY